MRATVGLWDMSQAAEQGSDAGEHKNNYAGGRSNLDISP